MTDIQHPRAAVAPVITAEAACSKTYDAVIVGSGISGAILAKELTDKGYHVLILEAGTGHDLSQHGYERYLETFYGNPNKDNNAPFPFNPNADMPRSSVLRKLLPGETNPVPYWVQYGSYVSDSVYTRVLGGTTVHWEAKAIRMLREDFKLRSNFGQGLDWPIGLDDLSSYYQRAELMLGVSGDVESQKHVGAEFPDGYVYPMVELKGSYLDQIVGNGLEGMTAEIDGQKIPLDLITFPQAKNADPNPEYAKWNGGLPYKPVGAISGHQDDEGERCQGNTNCVPLCPVQARFDARKILVKSLRTHRAELLNQAVASRVYFDPNTRAVTEIEVKVYADRNSPEHRTIRVRGKLFILAANAVENARLMLASAELNQQPVNDLMGRHLMDHPYLLCWGLLPVEAGTGRGPSCTSGICNFRNGNFRKKYASFAADIHNDGWGWATGAPVSDLMDTVDNGRFSGRALRHELTRRISRQLLLAYMIEMPADPDSRVMVDPKALDALGNMRPVVRFKLSEYSMDTAEYARNLSSQIFERLEAEDHTFYNPDNYGYLTYKGNAYEIRGGNHISGTHVMGTSPSVSVVDQYQKSWEHPNLYLVGPGSMPSIGSSNTTLTTAAIVLRTAEAVLKHLETL